MDVRILTTEEAEMIATALDEAVMTDKVVFVAWDIDGFKVKIGRGVWSPPLGTKQTENYYYTPSD